MRSYFWLLLLLSLLLFPGLSAFAQSDDHSRSERSWELGTSVQRAFFTNGDLPATGTELHVSRRLRGDLGLRGSLHRVVVINRNAQRSLVGTHRHWTDRRQTGGSIALLWDPIQFNTEALTHAVQFLGGPVLQIQRGETVSSVTYAPEGRVEETLVAVEGDPAYVVREDGSTYVLTTNSLDHTGLGVMLGMSYGLTYDRVTFRLRLSSQIGGAGRGAVHQAGVALGVRL